jgi:hypothetical protein
MDFRNCGRIFWLGLMIVMGCQSHSDIPTYSGLDGKAALNILVARAAAIYSVSAECELTLRRADGQTVHLDGAMVLVPPDRLRLRVWKLGQAVFDLTLRADGLWIETSAEAAQHGPVVPATLSAAQMARYLSWFEGGFFSSPELKVQPDSHAFIYRNDAIVCEVDRSTVTPRIFRLFDATGKTRYSLAMSDYRDISGTIWPTRLNAVDADGGVMEIQFSDLEFNSEIAPKAFEPPRGAEKQP